MILDKASEAEKTRRWNIPGVPDPLHRELKSVTGKQNITIIAYVIEAVREKLAREKS